MSYRSRKRILWWETWLMWPFVAAGKIAGRFFPLPGKHRVFLFFPNADIGGSPKVNADIIRCVQAFLPLVIFSKKPANNLFKDRFIQPGVRTIDLARLVDNKWYHFVNFFYRGVIAGWINAAVNPVVLGGECIYFYKIIPHLKSRIKCIEVCHLNTWINYTIGFTDRIDVRVFSTEYLKKQVAEQYQQNNLAPGYYDKLLFIENAIDIPEYAAITNPILQVVFIGRGSPQKRVYLVAEIAKEMHRLSLPVYFSFVGDVEKVIRVEDYPYCKFYGNVQNDELLNGIYKQSDVLILTSAFEGLPVVVMQMMAYGKVVVSTKVNGIPDYIFHGDNGYLLDAESEAGIVKQGVTYLSRLIEQPELIREFGDRSRKMAIARFSNEAFCKSYLDILQLQK